MWYRNAVVYQVYPLSFQDGDGDGRGDLRGILARLDYLSWLGVDAVWLCPVYPSPMKDSGYDVTDYESIDPVFGSLADFDRLQHELHGRSIRLLLDFVPNHTSAAHPWFLESRSSRDNAKHDWYIWANSREDGAPPNNWLSRFGGSAWCWEPKRRQFYLHSFLESQPDLNLRNPRVRAALHDAMRFWLRRGVDGFRIDAAAVLAKDEQLKDDPPNPEADENTPPPERQRRDYSDGQPEAVDWLAEMRDVSLEFFERVLLGEVDTAKDHLMKYYGSPQRPALHVPLNYLLMDTPWQADALARAIARYLERVPAHGWPAWAIGGQDKRRMASRVGRAQARNAALLALTLRGTAVFYAGDEMGMEQVRLPNQSPRDPFERRVPGYGMNRDPERTPMQWDASEHAGFTTGTPWLPLAPDFREHNVDAARRDARSILELYRRLIALRHSEPALVEGTLEGLESDGDVVSYVRRAGPRQLHVFSNVAARAQVAILPRSGRLLLSTYLDREDERVERLELRPDEGAVVLLDE